MVTSTNDLAKESKLAKPLALFADHQTAGRGQNTNTWNDLKGQCLIMSLAWPRLKNVPPPQTTMDFGKIVSECLKITWPNLKIHIKPPNDILLETPSSSEPKKAGGILIEAVGYTGDWTLIFGFGLNISGEPHQPSTSILKASQPNFEIEKVEDFVTTLLERCHKFVSQSL